MILRRLLTAAALLLLTAAVALPFARAHFAWRDLADAYIHLVRIYAVDAALGEGGLYPRWLSDLYLGYGYPLLNFYAPATYYLGAFFHRVGATIYGSLQLVSALSVVLGATGAYSLARGINSPRAAAVLAAGAYVLAPYPFLTNLYVRAAVPEALALGLAPWHFLAALRVVARPSSKAIVLLAVSVALLTLTHNVTALTALPFVGACAGYSAYATRRSPRVVEASSTGNSPLVPLGALALGFVGGLALSAFFWLPALAEAQYVQLDLLGGGIYQFRTWLFEPRSGLAQLSLAYDYSALDRVAPAKLSLVQGLLFTGSAVAAAISRRFMRALPWLLITTACVFLNTGWSSSLWTYLPLLPLTQFPWRLYGLAALGLSMAVSLALPTRVPQIPVAAVLIALLGYSALAQRPLLLAPDPPHDVDSLILASEEYNMYGAGTTSGGEFLPRTAQWGEGPRDQRRGIRIYDDLYPQASWQAGLARTLSGRAAITAIWRSPDGISLDVDAAEPTTVAFHQLAFPGWRGFLDDTPISLDVVPPDPSLNGSLGFITALVPTGPHLLEIRFGSTPSRAAGAALSGAAAGVLALAFISELVVGLKRPARSGLSRLPAAIAVGTAALLASGGAVVAVERPGRVEAPHTAATGRVVVDIISATVKGRTAVTSPLGSASTLFAPYVDVRYLTVGADTRPWLFLHPPSEVSIPLSIPPGAFLQSALAIDPVAWTQPLGDGVRFIGELETDGRRVTVLDRTLNPRARTEERRWIDVWADLRPYAGVVGRLVLRTEARDEPSYDWAGWAHPQIVVWRSARPVPSDPHPW